MSTTNGTTHDDADGRDTFELVATILLALAAIAIAWAGFQSAKWGGVQATNFSQAGADRTESVRASTLAGQLTSIDVTSFFEWLSAAVDDIDKGLIDRPTQSVDYQPAAGTLSGFIFERFRAEFRPAVQAWLDTSPFGDPDAPVGTPFEMPEYQLAAADEAETLLADAEQKSDAAGEANQTSDNYVVSAVIFAAALFFAALATKLTKSRYKIAALIVAGALFLGTVVYILTLPIAI